VTDLLTIGGGPTVPLNIERYTPSGVTRDRTIDGTDQKPVLDAIMELADNLDGYEIAIESELVHRQGVAARRAQPAARLPQARPPCVLRGRC
jgi:hypothetical protein